MSQQVFIVESNPSVAVVATPVVTEEKPGKYFAPLQWLTETLTLVGTLVYFAELNKTQGAWLKNIGELVRYEVSLVEANWYLAGRFPATTVFKAMVLSGLGLYLVNMIFGTSGSWTSKKSISTMLSSLVTSSLLHLMMMWAIPTLESYSSAKTLYISYLSFLLVEIFTAIYYIVKNDFAFDNTVISIPVRRLFKFLAIVSTTLFGISLPLATALYKTQIALVGSVAALVLSSAVFWLYTGRQMLVERSRSIAIEKETLSV